MGCDQSACRCKRAEEQANLEQARSDVLSEVPEVARDFTDSVPETGNELALNAQNLKLHSEAEDCKAQSQESQSYCESDVDTRDIASDSESNADIRRDSLGSLGLTSVTGSIDCPRADSDVASECMSDADETEGTGETCPREWSKDTRSTGIPDDDAKAAKRKKHKMITPRTASVPSGCLQVIIEKTGQIEDFYDFHEKLGAGSFGEVKRATVKASGAIRAVKTVSKEALSGRLNIITKEIEVSKMCDHPHIVKLYEIYENDDVIHLVMELSMRGNLQDLVIKRKHCSEQQTAVIMRQILTAVFYLHQNRICHRDLKPENVVVAHQKPLTLKLTDFGVSCIFQSGKMMTARVGSPAYMAPEVVRRKYTHMCDMWSCGALMFYVLCAKHPFNGDTNEDVMKNVAKGTYKFAGVEWVDVSQSTMEFIRLIMQKSYRARYTAEQALHHDWFGKYLPKTKTVELRFDLLDNLVSYRKLNRLKRSALIVTASMLKTEDVLENHLLFLALDKNGDGSLTLAELQKSVKHFKAAVFQKSKFMEGDLGKFFVDSANADSRKKPFTYAEFLAATFDRKRCITNAICKAAFTSFDKNGDGNISLSELSHGHLLGQLSLEELAQTLEDLDLNGDCYLDLEEFTHMMKN